ncbi:MAG: MFS transporter [Desulfobacteraceae bacterium]|nr:MFS transporter [Desulfobacteraceae bacterium]
MRNSNYIFLGVSSFQILAMFRRGLFYAYLSIYLRYFLGLSVTETTLFATLPMILNVVFQTFVWGPVSDKYQLRRTLIIWGEFLAGVGTILVWFFHILTEHPGSAGYIIIFGLCVVEIFWSMSNIGWSALISDIYPKEKRNMIQGRLASIGGLGRIAGVWIGGLLYDCLGMKYEGWGFHKGALFFIAAGVMFISVIPMLYMPEGGIRKDENKPENGGPGIADSSVKLYFIFLVAMMFINFGRNSIFIIQSQYLFLDTGFAVSSRVLAYIVNTESAAIIIMGLLAGWIGQMIGNGRSVCFGACAAIGSLLIFMITADIRLIYLGSFLRGTGEVILLSSSYAFASVLIPPEKRGMLFGLFNATLFLSWGVAGTCIAGPIVDLLISSGAAKVFAYKMAYLSAVVITFLGLIIQMVLVLVLVPRSAFGREPDNGL